MTAAIRPVRLYCLPYAGGSAAAYSGWKKLLLPAIELHPLELSGRGRRIAEPLYPDLPTMVEDVLASIEESVGDGQYMIFGHSMGAMVAYEASIRRVAAGKSAPSHLFVSGRHAPHLPSPEEKELWLLPEDEFREEVLRLGGTPPELFEYPELTRVFLPLLKNDFRLAATKWGGQPGRLPCGISVFAGKDEDLTPEQCEGWQDFTSGLCLIHYLEGDHFFIHKESAKIAFEINKIASSLP